MSAVEQMLISSHPGIAFERMEFGDVPDVVAIENDVYPFPWSRASFFNCLTEGYDCWAAFDDDDVLIGYFILMKVVDETHLLTFALRRDVQGIGYGKVMMEEVVSAAYMLGTEAIFLEVRPSNESAIRLYRRFGFEEVGRRKNYYPAANNTHEDAIMMRLPL